MHVKEVRVSRGPVADEKTVIDSSCESRISRILSYLERELQE